MNHTMADMNWIETQEAKIPHYTGADEFVIQGAFATCGASLGITASLSSLSKIIIMILIIKMI